MDEVEIDYVAEAKKMLERLRKNGIMAEIAKMLGQLRDDLVKEGFTRDEAIAICSRYQVTGK